MEHSTEGVTSSDVSAVKEFNVLTEKTVTSF